MRQVTASAPGKLMISGSYAVVHGEPCIVTAVDQRLQVNVRENGVDVFYMTAPDLGLQAYSKTIGDLGKADLPKAVRFIEILYKKFLEKYPQERGIVVTTKSDFSSSFGFGSSSAVTAAFAKALTSLHNLDFSEKELFDLCYETVLEVQGVGSGFDLAAAIWGKTLYYVSPAKIREQLDIYELPLVVGYTGFKADTPTLIRMVNTRLDRQPEIVSTIFKTIGSISTNLKEALAQNKWQEAGTYLNAHQEEVRKLGVSSRELENLIQASLDAGAYGATLSGAGDGDCMVAIGEPNKLEKIESAITQAGGEVMKVGLNAEGVRLEQEEK